MLLLAVYQIWGSSPQEHFLKKGNSSWCGYNIGWILSGKFMCRSRWTVCWESSWYHCTQDSWKKVFVRFVRSEVVWFHEIPCSCHMPIVTGMSDFHYTGVFLPAYHPPIHLSLDHHCGYCVLAWYTLAHHSCIFVYFIRVIYPDLPPWTYFFSDCLYLRMMALKSFEIEIITLTAQCNILEDLNSQKIDM